MIHRRSTIALDLPALEAARQRRAVTAAVEPVIDQLDALVVLERARRDQAGEAAQALERAEQEAEDP